MALRFGVYRPAIMALTGVAIVASIATVTASGLARTAGGDAGPSASATPDDLWAPESPLYESLAATPALASLPALASVPTPTATPAKTSGDPGWEIVVDDPFTEPRLASWWHPYDGRYASDPRNCATPSHAAVWGGSLHLVMSYEESRGLPCGAGWYTGGVALSGHSSVDQRVTLRFRVVADGVTGHFVVPMRWPDLDSAWPAAGEEDYCEGSSSTGCASYLHFGSRNNQVQHAYELDTSQWHVVRFQRLHHVVTVFIDDMKIPVWTYAGDSRTLPDTMKHVVLQQECPARSCPRGKAGREVIQIDWITVENPV